MNQSIGAAPIKNYLQSWLKQSWSSGQRYPRLWGRMLGVSLLVFGAIAIEIPGNPALAQVACTTVKRGDQSATVSAVQQTLANNDYSVGAVDGVFGSMTEIAVILFQRDSNLNPDGVVGSATCDALIKLNNSTLVKAPTAPIASNNGATATASSNTTLKLGDSGPAVTTLQNSLRSRGFNGLVVTGTFDEGTANTVTRLQVLEGLPATGEADPVTRTRLNQYLANNPPITPVVVSPEPINQPPPPITTPSAPPAPTVFTPTQTANSSTSTTLGDGYNVIVPARNNNLLAQVRIIVPGANLGQTRLGRYVDAGTYTNRYDAESLSNKLKARGLDARVVKR